MGNWQSVSVPGNWISLTPNEPGRFDAADGFVREFIRKPTSEITEMKVSGDRVRKIRYMRVTLPHSPLPPEAK